MKQLFSIILTLAIFSSCQKQVVPAEEINLGKDFVKFEEGHFVEYQVDSVHYDPFSKTTDTVTYFIKDVVGTSFADNQGRNSFIVNRYKRYNETESWLDESTYYVTQTSFNLEWVENNRRFIKLIFPTKLNTTWNGNKLILLDDLYKPDWKYKYTLIDVPINTGLIYYDKSLTVLHRDEALGSLATTGIYDPNQYSGYNYSTETYAKNVGLVYKETTTWVNQTAQHYKDGYTIIMRARNNN